MLSEFVLQSKIYYSPVVLEIYVAFCTQENNRAMGRRGIGSFLKGCIISLSEILEVKIKKCYYKEITETILEEER